jgi:hypothetical protein
MTPAHRPVGPWQKTAHIAATEGSWDDYDFGDGTKEPEDFFYGDTVPNVWIGFEGVPLSTKGNRKVKVNVDVLLNEEAPPFIIGIRIHGNHRLTTETFRALPLDGLRRAAAAARQPLLDHHIHVATGLMPDEDQPDVPLWDMTPGSSEYLAEVYRVFREARERGEPGTAAVMKAAKLREAQAQKWVSKARKEHETSA